MSRALRGLFFDLAGWFERLFLKASSQMDPDGQPNNATWLEGPGD